MTQLKKSTIGVLLAAVLGVGLITVSSWRRPSSKIIYNPSRSAPLGWYVVKPVAEVHRGDFVLVQLPAAIARLADERQYLPKTVPLLKNIGAVVGDRVCEQQGLVRINGVPIARALTRNRVAAHLLPGAIAGNYSPTSCSCLVRRVLRHSTVGTTVPSALNQSSALQFPCGLGDADRMNADLGISVVCTKNAAVHCVGGIICPGAKQGKIKGRGTVAASSRCLHKGFSHTRLSARG